MKPIPLFEASNKEILYHGSINSFHEFDFSKIGSNLTKYAYGICLTESPDVARQYVTRKHAYIYKVKAYNVSEYANWDDYANDYPNLISSIKRKLDKKGLDSSDLDADDMQISFLYKWLSDVLESQKEASEWFNIAGVNGVIVHDSHLGEVYIAFDPDELKIMGEMSEDDVNEATSRKRQLEDKRRWCGHGL